MWLSKGLWEGYFYFPNAMIIIFIGINNEVSLKMRILELTYKNPIF